MWIQSDLKQCRNVPVAERTSPLAARSPRIPQPYHRQLVGVEAEQAGAGETNLPDGSDGVRVALGQAENRLGLHLVLRPRLTDHVIIGVNLARPHAHQ